MSGRRATHFRWSAASCALIAISTGARAEAPPSSDDSMGQIVVTGSRFGGRVATQSPTPIDVISHDDLTRGSATDLQSMLRVVVPSFNTARPVAANSADFLKSPTLRGLSPGQLLLLVDGKRRHASPSLNLGNQIGRGDISYDFNAIPTLAISRIEVLRDGAAAQYGSDAIAGVLDVQLDESLGSSASGQYGETTRGDGRNLDVGISSGFSLGGDATIRLTAQYQNQSGTDRATPDTRQQYFGTNSAGALVAPSANWGSGVGLTPSNGTLDPREKTIDRNMWVFGEPKYQNSQLFGNAKVPLGAVALYAFGGFNRLDGISTNFFRRAGQDETVRSIYPDGFLPLQNVIIQNFSAAGGIRSNKDSDLTWDISTVYGGGKESFAYLNTDNVSQGNASKTTFHIRGALFHQWTSNADLAYQVDLGDGSPLKIAAGAEYRHEFLNNEAGEPDSYANGGVAIIGGPNNGKPAAIGAQPGAGLTAADANRSSRHSKAIYGEAEKTLFDRLLLTGAVRHEDFSDFGATTNYKLSGRFELVHGFALRASYGTGFRAPALQQSYATQTSTQFVNGNAVKIRVFPVSDPIAQLVGAKPLKPEKSENVSVGGVISLPKFTLSVDAYQIRIDNRIVISSNFTSTNLTNFLVAHGVTDVSTIAYLTNAVDTTNRGIDLTANYHTGLGSLGHLNVTLAGTISSNKFRRIDGTPAALSTLGITTPLFDLTQQIRFSKSIPREKATLNLTWEKGRFTTSLTNTYYGSVSQIALTGRTQAQVNALIPGYDVTVLPDNAAGTTYSIIQRFKPDVVTDLSVSYKVNKALTMTVGGDNIFDIFPTKNIASTAASVAAGTNGSDNNGTFPYAYIAPFGVNGATLYIKAGIKF